MRNLIKLSFVLIVSVLVCSFSRRTLHEPNSIHFNKDNPSRPPEFRDGGKAVKNLKKTYNCESIEFENWEDDDATDSTLTVCLINSTRVATPDGDKGFEQLKAIASQIKKAVKHPEVYKSYYIIFVKQENLFGQPTRSHTAGADIPGTGL